MGDSSNLTPAQCDEILGRISQSQTELQSLRRFGLVQICLRNPDPVTVPASLLDEHLRKYRNTTLEEFLGAFGAWERRPKDTSNHELVLREMWVNATRSRSVREKELMCSLTGAQVPFAIAAQMVVLAEGRPGRVAEIAENCGFDRGKLESRFFMTL
jgi:hypothetical protein